MTFQSTPRLGRQHGRLLLVFHELMYPVMGEGTICVASVEAKLRTAHWWSERAEYCKSSTYKGEPCTTHHGLQSPAPITSDLTSMTQMIVITLLP
jgi:hypothetical protein